jgi:hypothetical protein
MPEKNQLYKKRKKYGSCTSPQKCSRKAREMKKPIKIKNLNLLGRMKVATWRVTSMFPNNKY